MRHRYRVKKTNPSSHHVTTRYRQKQRQQDYRYQVQRKLRRHIHHQSPQLPIKPKHASFRLSRKQRWIVYYLWLTCLLGSAWWVQEQLRFTMIESQSAFKLQVHYPWVQERHFQLWWGEKFIIEQELPASHRQYLTFEKEWIHQQDQTLPFVPVVPTLEETNTTVKLSWEAAEPQTNCQSLKVLPTEELLAQERTYCVTTPIHHYELRKGFELVAVTQALTMELEKTQLQVGMNEYEWVVVNENGLEVIEPLVIEYYPFEMTEDYRVTNPTPYETLTYEIWQDKQWKPMDSNDVTPFLIDQQSPQLTEMVATPYSSAKEIRVVATGIDPEETLSYSFKISHGTKSFYPVLEASYQSNIAYYEAGLGDASEALFKNETGSFTFSSLNPGTYTVWVRAVDHQGNVSEPISKQVTLQPFMTSTPTTQTSSSSVSSTTSETTHVTTNQSSSTESSQSSTSQSTNSSTNHSSSSSQSATTSRPTDQKAEWLYEMTSCYQGVSQDTCDSILTAVHRVIPKHVVQTLYVNGSTIDIMPDTIREIVRNLTGWDAGWNYHGVTFYNSHGQSKHIFTSVKGGRNIFIHEMGHLYDYFKGMLSSTDEFVTLYQAEKGIFTGLYASSSVEFFAETFRMYITEPSTLSSKAPKTYAYMKQLVG